MNALLCFPKLDLNSGTPQLLRMQAQRLRAEGIAADVVCQRGALRFRWRTGMRAQRISVEKVRARASSGNDLVVEHGILIPEAHLVFVHNLASEANRYLLQPSEERAGRERAFFASLRPDTPIAANSELVRSALIEHFGLSAQRVLVHRPGYQSERFVAASRAELSLRARQRLGIDASVPLVGFVTSGDFHKRGLDTFLSAAERIAVARPEVRFLVVGSRRLPEHAARHECFVQRRAFYVPKNRNPEQWIAALDVFLYAARFEEFGMVVLEALALGVPVLTSRRVGAAECLPDEYSDWLAAEPKADDLAERALRLLADPESRNRLAAAGVTSARSLDDQAYAAATVATIMAQKDRLK
jgi:glycosyltransferase involved in cell wall biosynthesis